MFFFFASCAPPPHGKTQENFSLLFYLYDTLSSPSLFSPLSRGIRHGLIYLCLLLFVCLLLAICLLLFVPSTVVFFFQADRREDHTRDSTSKLTQLHGRRKCFFLVSLLQHQQMGVFHIVSNNDNGRGAETWR